MIEELTPQTIATGLGTKAANGAGQRRDEKRAACRDFLTKWRMDCWHENHSDQVWGPEVLLPDKVLTKLVATGSLRTKEDVRDEVEGWWLWERYSQEVLDGLQEIDMMFEAAKAAKDADRLEQLRIERERRLAIAQEERQHALEEKERKRREKEAVAQEERNRKEEEKRQREELKRQKEQEKAEAKRQKEELKRQREEEKAEAKRQREESKRQREELKRQREEAKLQREELKHQREEAKHQREKEQDELGNRDAKRQRTDHSLSTPISPPSTSPPTTPSQSMRSTRPRPRPTKRPPPNRDIENLNPMLLQQSASNSHYPYLGVSLPLCHPPSSPSHRNIPPWVGLTVSEMEPMHPCGPASPSNNQCGSAAFHCERFS